jgi:dihydroorotase
MLELVRQKKIDIETVVKKMCHAPADLFRIRKRGYIREGYFADLVLVDMNAPWVVSKNNLLYKCNWSPFEGRTFNSKVIFTIVNGKVVCENGTLFENAGKRLEFDA